jgi:nitrite reductase (NADH) small subunit
MTKNTKGWLDVCSVEAIPARGSRVLKTDAGNVAVFRTASDEVYALVDRCPHAGGPLSQGIVHGAAVTCPLHNWIIDLATGNAMGADTGHVPPIATRVEGGRVLVRTSDLKGLCRNPGAAMCAQGS